MSQPNVQQSIYNETGAIAKTINQIGTNVAGRDNNIIINERRLEEVELRFTILNLDPYTEDKYVPPTFTSDVLNIAIENRLVIVGGSYEFDKVSFIRHLATIIKKEHSQFQAVEWVDRSIKDSLYFSLSGKKEPTIFIFTQITPQDVRHNIEKIAKLAVDHDFFILMCTDLPLEAWELNPKTAKSLWFEIPSSKLYSEDVLVIALLEELKLHAGKIDLLSSDFQFLPESKLAGKLTTKTVAIRLETIDRIKLFVRTLVNETSTLSEKNLLDLINSISDNSNDVINHWFNTLNNKEKELTIALCLFDGLYDDQFFSCLERLIQASWEARNTALMGVDYHDIDTLFSFFSLEDVEGKTKLLRSRLPNQRFNLFNKIWFSYRRHLLASLPVIVALIKDSIYRPHSSGELFESTTRRSKLQNVLSESLSDIGRIHFSAVEPVFLELASDEHIGIQEITAMALARWREFDLDEELFQVLDVWRKESRFKEVIQDLLRGNKAESKILPEVVIRSTIALTIGFASNYDKPNELSRRLIEKFEELANDPNPYVRERFTNITLPLLTQNHLSQLKDLLFKLTRYGDYVESIAIGISEAYKDRPEQVEEVLMEWLNYCRSNSKRKSTAYKITHRDMVLITIIMALSKIKYKAEYAFNAEKAYQIIEELQQNDYHPPVKEWYLEFIINQIKLHASKISPTILRIIQNIGYKDRPKLINYFTDIYIEQRRNLGEGERSASFRDENIPIWINAERPQTEIEATMQEWLLKDNITGQQIALETLYAFANNLDVAESVYIEQVREKQKKSQQEDSESVVYQPEPKITNYQHTFASKVIAWFSLSDSNPGHRILKNILPVLIWQKLMSTENLKMIAKNLRRSKKNELQSISTYLVKFPRIYSNYSTLSALLFIVFFAIIIIYITFILG